MPCEKYVGSWSCGQCATCTARRARVWTARLLIEQDRHACTSFVTLTYDEEHLPPDGSLRKRDLQLYLKRLRRRLPFRFFAAGEYGERGGRPHYHLLLFGVHHGSEHIVREWSCGLVDVRPSLDGAAAYVAGYVVKKLGARAAENCDRLRVRPFVVMSRRPGIGLGEAVRDLSQRLLQNVGGHYYLSENRDVPGTLSFGGKSLPLGQTFRRQLRKAVFDDEKVPDEAKRLSALRAREKPLPGSKEHLQERLARIQQAHARLKIQASKKLL